MIPVSKHFALLAFLILNFISEIKSDCLLSLGKDFGSPGPVFIRNSNFLTPNAKGGTIAFGKSETVTVSCPGNKRKIVLANETTRYDTLEAQCIRNTTFRIDRRFVQFKEIRCNTQPWFTAQEYPENCRGRNKIYHVGYKVKNAFYTLYKACFDKYLLHTHYVHHQLTPVSSLIQHGLKRPQFIEGNLYENVRMNDVYKINSQKMRIDAILGPNMATYYITKNQYLSRGHLAARADFATSAESRATFHYVNTAPQWMRGNAGDWAALEDALRRRVQALGTNVTVFTGTHGLMTLPSRGGHMKEMYLHADINNNPVVPVPMYFYKLVYDPMNKNAAAFISINSSFYNSTMINSLAFCEDICNENPKYSWLTWRSNDGTYSFCCDYHTFVDEVDYLPALDVRGRFY